MTRYVMAIAAIVLALPAAFAAEPALTENHWRLSQVMSLGFESPLMLFKIEKKDGKTTAKVVDDAIKAESTGGEVTADSKSVTVNVQIGGSKYKFEGIVDSKDTKVIRGVLTDGARTFKCLLASQEGEKIAAIVNPKPPAPLLAVQKLNSAVVNLRGQIARAKDVNDKADLQEQLKAAQSEVDEKAPALLREVLAKHADSPFAVEAASRLLAGAAKYKAKEAEIAAWAKTVEDDASRYGAKLAIDAAVQVGEMLISQKEVAASAMPIAKRLVDGLKDSDPLASQSKVLTLLTKANKAAGKMDAAIEARLVKVEKALDEEYVKKVPPFKPEKFAGRKDKDAKRVAVMELFTGAQCPPCVAADVAFDALEKAYSPTDLVLIQYHMHIPGPDPLTNLDSMARWSYYREKYPMDVRGTPTSLFNGKPQAPSGGGMAQAQGKFNQYKQIIDELLEEKTTITIGGSAKLSGDKLAVDVKVDGIKEPNKNIKLRVVLVEETIKYIGGNNLRFHHQVVRAIPNVKDGDAITEKSFAKTITIDLADVKKGLTKYLDDFASTRPFPNTDRPMDLKHLKVIALVQDDESLEILNAMQFDVK